MMFQKLSPLALIAVLLIVGESLAQDRADTKSLQPENRPATEAKNELPTFLGKLNLTGEQQQQIRQVMREHDQKAEKIWTEFHRLHWQTVEAEASLAAANALAGHDHDAHHQTDSNANTENRQADQPVKRLNANLQRNKREASPEAVARAQQDSGTPTDRQVQKNQDQSDSTKGIDLNILGLRIAVLGNDGTVREIQLAGNVPRHETECEICAAHEKELKSLWAKIHELHGQLVQIEAERMIAVESKLTEDQLNQLQGDNPYHLGKPQGQTSQKPHSNNSRQSTTRKDIP